MPEGTCIFESESSMRLLQQKKLPNADRHPSPKRFNSCHYPVLLSRISSDFLLHLAKPTLSDLVNLIKSRLSFSSFLNWTPNVPCDTTRHIAFPHSSQPTQHTTSTTTTTGLPFAAVGRTANDGHVVAAPAAKQGWRPWTPMLR